MKHLQSILLIVTILGCAPSPKVDETTVDVYYSEQHRPQFHFSPETSWMNDPNGMVYYEGEYHLFYQYYPDSTVWGPMHWGHAVSTDLVSWEHLPIALYPDSLGYIFSGSAVIDWNNTSGFGSDENPPMVAIFTHHLMEGEKAGRTDYQYQSIAYSLDKGRTWTKYEGNPVLPNQGIKDFRDPKVFWHEGAQKWVMILAVWDHVELYASPDLKSWEKLSDFGLGYGNHGGVWECPDLFELAVEGTEETKWVMIVSIGRGGPNKGSATQYFVGDFDGVNFTNENPKKTELWIDYGTDNYAGVTWSDIPEEDGRRLFIGWMSNWLYATIVPTEKWRSAMTIARELTLKNTSKGTRVFSNPVEEFAKVRGISKPIEAQTVTGELAINGLTFPVSLSEINLEFSEFEKSSEFGIELSNSLGQKVLIGFEPDSNRYFIDRTNSGKSGFHEVFANRQFGDRVSGSDKVGMKVLVDVSSIELFADEGATVMTALVFPDEPYSQVKVFTKVGNVRLNEGRVVGIKRIW